MFDTKSLKYEPDPKTNEFIDEKISEKEVKIESLNQKIADIDFQCQRLT